MNVTAKKSECDPKQRMRQLEVAIENALRSQSAVLCNVVSSNILLQLRGESASESDRELVPTIIKQFIFVEPFDLLPPCG